MTRRSPVAAIGFVPFLGDVLDVRLEPGQRAFWQVAADAVQPGELEDRDLGRRVFGEVAEVPLELRHTVALVKGARVGFTYLGSLRLLHLALTVRLDTLAPGEVAAGVIVAPDLRLARQALRYAVGAAEATPSIRTRLRAVGTESFTVARESGRSVEVVCLPATRGGSAVRGRSLVGALLDEASFFRDDDFQVNDADVYKGIAPRVLAGGQVLIGSTPWVEVGLLGGLFAANFGHPTTALAAHLPTTVARSDGRILALVERERARDPENAAREFDGEFLERGTSLFFDATAIKAAVVPSLVLPRPQPAGPVSVAADLGFVHDASACVAIASDGDRFVVLDLVEVVPPRGEPLRPSVVVARFAEVARRYGARAIVSDVHYRESVREHLEAEGLALSPAPEGQAGKVDMYTRTRALMNEGRLVLPDHARLLRQLHEVMSAPASGGGLRIKSPRRRGSHGDIVSALCAAVWGARRGRRPGAHEFLTVPGRWDHTTESTEANSWIARTC